jgi:GAF domain-containing protein
MPGIEKSDIEIPLIVRGEEIGALNIWSSQDRLPQDDLALLQDLGMRLSQSLDSARLFSETQQRAEYERMAAQAAARMRESFDVETVLKSAADDIYELLNLSNLTIDLSAPALQAENSQPVQDERT